MGRSVGAYHMTISRVDLILLFVQNKQTQEYYEVEVELITGRTHQLRATFAAEGAPIVHDTM